MCSEFYTEPLSPCWGPGFLLKLGSFKELGSFGPGTAYRTESRYGLYFEHWACYCRFFRMTCSLIVLMATSLAHS